MVSAPQPSQQAFWLHLQGWHTDPSPPTIGRPVSAYLWESHHGTVRTPCIYTPRLSIPHSDDRQGGACGLHAQGFLYNRHQLLGCPRRTTKKDVRSWMRYVHSASAPGRPNLTFASSSQGMDVSFAPPPVGLYSLLTHKIRLDHQSCTKMAQHRICRV